MAVKIVALTLSLIFIHFANGSVELPPCHVIRICDHFKFTRIESDVDNRAAEVIFDLKNETDLALGIDWYGMIPRTYKVDLTIPFGESFHGRVQIGVDIVRRTNRIHINIGRMMKVFYELIKITTWPKRDGGCLKFVEVEGCIQNATYLVDQKTAVIDLTGVYLESDFSYNIEFPNFVHEGDMFLDLERTRNGMDYVDKCFPLRNARSMFPCFDHPVFKSKFELCVERYPALMVVTNTAATSEKVTAMSQWLIKDCYKATPPMSTASLGLTLLHRDLFEKAVWELPDDGTKTLSVELFYAIKERKASMDTFLHTAVDVLMYVEHLTQFEYPLSKLSIIVLEDGNTVGCDGFGLIYVDLRDTPEAEWESLIFSKIVRQWLGHLITIRDWREICIQEGLADYLFLRSISKESGAPLEDIMLRYESASGVADGYEPLTEGQLRHAAEIEPRCMLRSLYFFYTLDQFFGTRFGEGSVVVQMLRSMLWDNAYKAVAIKTWDQNLAMLVGLTGNVITRYFEGWFGQPGMLYLIVSKNKASNKCIRVRQVVIGSPNSVLPNVARPVPIQVYSLDEKITESTPIVLRHLDQHVCGGVSSRKGGYLVDPSHHAWARKVYPISNYLFIVREYRSRNKRADFLEQYQYANMIADLCYGLKEDLFPLKEDRTGTVAAWKVLAEMVASEIHEGTSGGRVSWCHCCMEYIASGGKSADGCNEESVEMCRQLKITRIVNGFGSLRDEL